MVTLLCSFQEGYSVSVLWPQTVSEHMCVFRLLDMQVVAQPHALLDPLRSTAGRFVCHSEYCTVSIIMCVLTLYPFNSESSGSTSLLEPLWSTAGGL